MSRPNGYHNGSGLGSMPGSAMSSNTRLATPQGGVHRPVSPGSAGVSRAEKFEDEKRRIIESCFSKQDQTGQLTESYITHIRIQEDAQYPTAPPPPTSPAENKKPRVIIIAVRSTGRVRMHKARENANGTFSIGKTWNMEELSAIESYSNAGVPAHDEREAQQRAWAGSLGFTVTITKPYYWQAGTSKEKDFFIASIVKIFRKYTKGQVPELRGFDEMERAAVLGIPPGQTAPPPEPRTTADGMEPPQPPFARREQSQEGSRYRSSPGPPPGSTPASRNPSESPARYNHQQPGGGPRAFMSTDQLRAGNRDVGRQEHRPGTSPAPDYRSSPAPSSQRSGGQTPQAMPIRSESPATPNRDRAAAPPPFAPQSPARQRLADRSVSDSSQNFQLPPPRRAGDRGGQYGTPPPQMPPIETGTPIRNGSTADSSDPQTATTVSSPGFDLGDAATIGAITSFWAPDSTATTAVPPLLSDAASPPTPERSKRRPPPIEPRPSDSMTDLRPPPLSQARRLRQDSGSRAFQDQSGQTTPKQGDHPEVRPLQVQNKSETPPPPATAQQSPEGLRNEVSSPEQSESLASQEEEEQFRPGLGPMFKKRALADRFKKAAHTANAFKPRPGGAAEKILKAKAEREAGPDGITGVVPRPVARPAPVEPPPAASTTLDSPATEDPPPIESPAVEAIPPTSPVQEQPSLDAPYAMDTSQGVALEDEVSHLEPPSQVDGPPEKAEEEEEGEEEAEKVEEERQYRKAPVKIKRRAPHQDKYLLALGVDRSLLEGRGLEFELMLTDFGWSNDVLQPKHLAALEADIRREQGRVEAGSWLSHTDTAREERVTNVETLLDKAIAECDELEGLLTLYNVELSSLNDDIAFIEAQSQGLQVQSANQKLLQSELQGLVETMSLDRRNLEPIRYGDLSSAASLEEVEQSLVRLYQALLTMDPSIRTNASGRPRSRNGISEIETSSMAALREKKMVYQRESSEFCQRLMQFLDSRFTTSMNAAKGHALRAPASGGLPKLHADAFSEARSGLWMYSPVILFTKELNATAWQNLLRTYQTRAKPLYLDAFKQNLSNWKRAARAPAGDELDVLFTTQEKEDPTSGGITSTARKMTVKRSHTLARTLRGASSGEKQTKSELRTPGAMTRAVAFAGAMDEMAPLMSREQNFVVDLFHATSLETVDFTDVVLATPPGRRHGTSLLDRKPTEPDREIARLVMLVMAEIFGFFTDELSSLLDWSVVDDPLQGVGVLANLSRHTFYLQDSNQEFLLQVVETLSARLQTRFAKFVEEQIRAIEDTKVKIKKRKGVIAFMKTFPHFSAAVENIFASVAGNDYEGPADCVMEVRRLIDNAYERINRAMFDSLKIIAKESPLAGVQAPQQSRTGDDPEDKEMLNYHILLIENMNHYIEEVDDAGRDGVLAEWKNRAMLERLEALEAYVGRVLRRPLGKLLDFLEATESILAASPGNPTTVSSRPSYSRKAMRTVLAQYDSKEVRRGIDTLRRRIEKHFGEGDEENISRSLVNLVCKECERGYERVLERTEKLVSEVYPPTEGEKTVEIDFSRSDIQADFRR